MQRLNPRKEKTVGVALDLEIHLRVFGIARALDVVQQQQLQRDQNHLMSTKNMNTMTIDNANYLKCWIQKYFFDSS